MIFKILHIRDNFGAVLVVGLFTLALITLLGTASTTTSRTDVSISGNNRVLQESFYIAESALIVGEAKAIEITTGNTYPEITGFYETGKQNNWNILHWDEYDSFEFNIEDILPEKNTAAASPRYTIERRALENDSMKLGSVPKGKHHFNITASASGSNISTKSVLRSILVIRLD